LCTDGKSNVGLGALDRIKTDEDQHNLDKFYQRLADVAKINGTAVSVISIKGDDCRMENLGILSDTTGGAIDIVNPLNITSQFSNIISSGFIATNASVTFVLHKDLYVQEDGDESGGKLNTAENRIVRDVGNVTDDTELAFKYGVKPEIENISEKLPFQTQIYYTKLDGSKYVRVITLVQQTTSDRKIAEQEANVEILAAAAVQKGARLAQEGDYTKARLNNYANLRLIERAANTDEKKKKVENFVKFGEKVDVEMRNIQKEEKDEGLRYSDDEDDAGESVEKEKRHARKKMQRKAKRADVTSNVLYQMKSANTHMF